MNKIRIEALREVIAVLESIKDNELYELYNEEEEYKDNIPENLRSSERYDVAEAACDSLDEAISSIEDAISSIEEAIE